MRKVTLSNGKEIEVRPLNGKEVESFTTNSSNNSLDTFKVLKMLDLYNDEIMALPFPDLLKIQQAINAETFGLDTEIKN